MKIATLTSLFTLTLAMVIASSGFATDAEKAADRKDFSKNIRQALASENKGVQLSAIGHVIHYGDMIDVGSAGAIDIMHIYRNDSDVKVRQFALTALPRVNNELVNGFLRRAVRFEETPVLKRQLQFIIADQKAK